jgi:hypothetical protein
MSIPSRFQKLVQEAKSCITEIAPADAAKEVERGALLIDIREKEDRVLPALGYSAAAHTTLPVDLDAWASTDSGKTWTLRVAAAARPDTKATMCHYASGIFTRGELLVLARGMDDAANERGRRAPN